MQTIPLGEMTPQQILSAIAIVGGALVSLLSIYVPGFNTWYAGIDTKWKPLLQLGFNAAGFLILMAISCLALAQWLPCTQAGWADLAGKFILMLLGNLLTYKYVSSSLEPKSVVLRKEQRGKDYPLG